MALKRGFDAVALRSVEVRDYPRDLGGLSAQLRDADPAARRWAARDLAGIDNAGPVVCAALQAEADPSVRAALFTTASRIGGSAVVKGLLPLLRTDDAGLRNGAIEVLAGLPDAVAPHIESLLNDGDSDVRIFTVNMLCDLRHARVPVWLAQVLEADPEINVVGAALDVLAEVGTAQALPALHAVRQRFADSPFIGFAADIAIGRIEQA
jgi:HEAT repeat protein